MRKLGVLDLLGILKRNKELSELAYSMDFTEIDDKIHKVYLKRMALNTCANFIARAVSQSEIKIDNKTWYYKLNVRPNTDMNASDFWQKIAYKLITENRVLVVLSDSDDLLIADGWSRKEYAVYEDRFEDVMVKDYTFSRSFRMSEVLYLEYSNEKLERFMNGILDDYGELYGRLIEAAKRNSQIRGTISVEGTSGTMTDDATKRLQEYVGKLFKAFKERSIAVVPLTKGFSYEEHSNSKATSNITIDQISKIPSDLIDMAADAVGIPAALVHGTRAELKDNIKAFNMFCLPPILKKIEDELNAKIYEPWEYSRENRIEVVGLNRPDIFELAEPIDKLISSSAFNPNEIRKELGYDERAGGEKYVMTKNLETTEQEETKGGGDE